MAQLTIYIDDKTLARIERSASQEKDSISRWVKKRLTASLDEKGWPAGYFEFLQSAPCKEIEIPRDLSSDLDCKRAKL